MLIINADDWGGWKTATDAALACYEKGRITSVSAMVFMEDSERAARLARDIGVDVGLHLNLNQTFTGDISSRPGLAKCHQNISRFLQRTKYALLVYNPFLRQAFRRVYQWQMEEFIRLYAKPPSHIDGHQHMHLCSNMVLDSVFPRGCKIRRSFSFWPGEKSWLNRIYRRFVNYLVLQRCRSTDYFFALSQCLDSSRFQRLTELARVAKVEMMTHPSQVDEYKFLNE